METKPTLLVVLGPTGSGKGSLPEKVADYLKLGNIEWENVVVDNLVETSLKYKVEVFKILKEFLDNDKSSNDYETKLNSIIDNPTEDMKKQFTTAKNSFWFYLF